MSFLSLEFMRKVEMGLVDGWTFARVFGRSASISTSLAPIAMTNKYPTPTGLTSLELVSSSASDTSAGIGARTVKVVGISTSYAKVEETVTMNGTTAVALANQYYRVLEMYVATSGTYYDASPSHVGTLTLRISGAGTTWFQIAVDGGVALGRTLIAGYTIEAGYTGYVYLSYLSVESTKAVTFYFFTREGIDVVAAPYTPLHMRAVFDASAGYVDFNGSHFVCELAEKSDVGMSAKVSSGTAAATAEFKIYLKAN